MSLAAANSQFGLRRLRWRRTYCRASTAPRWTLAVSHPMAESSWSSSRLVGRTLSSMREQCGDKRRTIQRRVLDVEVAHGENPGSLGEVGADLRPDLHPAIEGCSKKRKYCCRHLLVLQARIRLHQRGVAAEPLFKAVGCLDNIHCRPAGNDRTGPAKCQRGANSGTTRLRAQKEAAPAALGSRSTPVFSSCYSACEIRRIHIDESLQFIGEIVD